MHSKKYLSLFNLFEVISTCQSNDNSKWIYCNSGYSLSNNAWSQTSSSSKIASTISTVSAVAGIVAAASK